MKWVDIILLGVIALSAVLAFFHGLGREALGVAGWVGAAVVALLARKQVQPFLDPYFTPPWLAEAIGAGVNFFVTKPVHMARLQEAIARCLALPRG